MWSYTLGYIRSGGIDLCVLMCLMKHKMAATHMNTEHTITFIFLQDVNSVNQIKILFVEN